MDGQREFGATELIGRERLWVRLRWQLGSGWSRLGRQVLDRLDVGQVVERSVLNLTAESFFLFFFFFSFSARCLLLG